VDFVASRFQAWRIPQVSGKGRRNGCTHKRWLQSTLCTCALGL